MMLIGAADVVVSRCGRWSLSTSSSLAILLGLFVSGAFVRDVQARQVVDLPDACTAQEIVDDASGLDCIYLTDNECDAGIFCPDRTDCFDCDPCLQYSGTSCEECIAAGCHWCPHSNPDLQLCNSPLIALAYNTQCLVSSFDRYVDTCPSLTCEYTPNMDGPPDSCRFRFDGECDEGGPSADGTPNVGIEACGQNTDCFDCDPCHQYDFTSCEECTSASGGLNCNWCGKDGSCFSSDKSLLANSYSRPLDVFVLTCEQEDWAFAEFQCASIAPNNNVYSDPLYTSNQWVFDLIDVEPVWRSGITGSGIGIRINDDGVDATHPEFAAAGKFDAASSCSTYLPDFFNATSSHGTTCAAIAAGGADNNVCSVGIAPDATLSGCRVISDNPTEEIGDVSLRPSSSYDFLYLYMDNMHISSNSYNIPSCRPKEDGRRSRRRLQATCPFRSTDTFIAFPCRDTLPCANVDWSDPNPDEDCRQLIIEYCTISYYFDFDPVGCGEFFDLFVDCDYVPSESENQALIRGTSLGRDGKGIIYIYSSSNNFNLGQRTEMLGPWLNTRFSMSVGAVGKDGLHTRYSSTGTSLFVSAPGGDIENYRNFISVVAGGGCRDATVGTSWAAPVVSGVVALVLQANPELTWRDVRGILARTSSFVDDSRDDSWVTNGAGFRHSDRYGFGIVNASAAVAAAQTWELYSRERMIVAQSGTLNVPLPEYTPQRDPVVTTLEIEANQDFITESVYLYIRLDHFSRGDLKITLTSPMGTESVVHPSKRPENSNGVELWKFVTNKCWGESPAGTWTLSIEDERAGDLSECEDDQSYAFPFPLNPGEIFNVTCRNLDNIEFCQNGGTDILGDPYSGPDDPALTGYNGKTPAEACCSCGGGFRPETFVDNLEDWMVMVFGRGTVTSDDTPPPTALNTFAPTTASTSIPTPAPTSEDTSRPTSVPISEPTQGPTGSPTSAPTGSETTLAPTDVPASDDPSTEAPTGPIIESPQDTPAPTDIGLSEASAAAAAFVSFKAVAAYLLASAAIFMWNSIVV